MEQNSKVCMELQLARTRSGLAYSVATPSELCKDIAFVCYITPTKYKDLPNF